MAIVFPGQSHDYHLQMGDRCARQSSVWSKQHQHEHGSDYKEIRMYIMHASNQDAWNHEQIPLTKLVEEQGYNVSIHFQYGDMVVLNNTS